ncbi:MAG: TetR/AcrR family transcriptional regulator [Nevskiales bacterium]
MTRTLKEFRRDIGLTMQGIVRELYREHSAQFQVQSEAVAVPKLVTIIEATLTLANEKGFHSMSLRDLAKATGMSLGGLYAYIRSKDDLVALIQTHGHRLALRTLSRQLEGLHEPREKLRAAIRAHLYLSEVLRAWFYFSYMEAKNLAPAERQQAVEAEIATETLFRELIEQGQAAGLFRATDAQLTAALLKAMLQDWYLKRGKYRSRGVDVERYADFVIEIVERMLNPA